MNLASGFRKMLQKSYQFSGFLILYLADKFCPRASASHCPFFFTSGHPTCRMRWMIPWMNWRMKYRECQSYFQVTKSREELQIHGRMRIKYNLITTHWRNGLKSIKLDSLRTLAKWLTQEITIRTKIMRLNATWKSLGLKIRRKIWAKSWITCNSFFGFHPDTARKNQAMEIFKGSCGVPNAV